MEADDHENKVDPNERDFNLLLPRSLLVLRSEDEVQFPNHFMQQQGQHTHKVQGEQEPQDGKRCDVWMAHWAFTA